MVRALAQVLVAASLAVLVSCSLDDAGTGPVSGASSAATGAGATTSTSGAGGADAASSASQVASATGSGGAGPGGGGTGGEAPGGNGGSGDGGGASPTCGDGIVDDGEECDGPAPCDGCVMVCPPGWTKGATATCYGRAAGNGDGDEVVAECDATREEVAIHPTVVLRPATPDVLADLITVALVCGAEIEDDGCWIGADDLETEGTFRWSSGEDFTYASGLSPWAEGEPSGDDDDDDCVEVILPDGGDRPLNDEACWRWQRVICEIVPPGTPSPPAGG